MFTKAWKTTSRLLCLFLKWFPSCGQVLAAGTHMQRHGPRCACVRGPDSEPGAATETNGTRSRDEEKEK